MGWASSRCGRSTSSRRPAWPPTARSCWRSPPGSRANAWRADGGRPERLEREPYEFFEEVAAAYEQLAQAEPERFAVLDATAPAQDVLAAALDALKHDLAGFGSD